MRPSETAPIFDNHSILYISFNFMDLSSRDLDFWTWDLDLGLGLVNEHISERIQTYAYDNIVISNFNEERTTRVTTTVGLPVVIRTQMEST